MNSPNENYTSWTVGMPVQCVDDEFDRTRADYKYGVRDPVKGEVYTIRSITKAFSGYLCITLNEIRNPVLRYWHGQIGEKLFRAHRFRPVQARKSDISIFKAILSNPHKKLPTRETA